MQFDHFNLQVPASLLEPVKDFYRDLFGWQPGPRPAFSRPGYWLYQDQQPLLHLTQSETSPSCHSSPLNHLAFRCDDLQAFRQRLELRGIAYQQCDLPGQPLSQLFFCDPLGLRIEINGPIP